MKTLHERLERAVDLAKRAALSLEQMAVTTR
jgi:hypothetical protein